jgi:hypothetical protein
MVRGHSVTLASATLLCLSLLGCATGHQPSPCLQRVDSPGMISLCEALELANAQAAAKLDEFNATWKCEYPGVDPDRFELADYDKAVCQDESDGRSYFAFLYHYRKPVRFLGHPAHFGVWVYRDDGETRFFYGR